MLLESNTLAQHHRRCDALFTAAREAAAAARPQGLAARVSELREALLSHFRYEEEHVFPLYEQASGLEGATEWLCAQHDDMRGMLWILGTISPEASAPLPGRARRAPGGLRRARGRRRKAHVPGVRAPARGSDAMALMITAECTACDACKPVCPNEAIAAGEPYVIDALR